MPSIATLSSLYVFVLMNFAQHKAVHNSQKTPINKFPVRWCLCAGRERNFARGKESFRLRFRRQTPLFLLHTTASRSREIPTTVIPFWHAASRSWLHRRSETTQFPPSLSWSSRRPRRELGRLSRSFRQFATKLRWFLLASFINRFYSIRIQRKSQKSSIISSSRLCVVIYRTIVQ